MNEPPTMHTGSADPALVKAELGLLLMTVIWAVNFSFIKVGLADIPPFAFNALRFPLASLLMLAVLRGLPGPRLPRARDRLGILALGLLGNVVYQMFFISGIARTRAGNASLLLAGTPILTALLSSAVGHERVRPRVWLGVVATIVGIALVVVGGSGGLSVGTETLTGDLIMTGATVTWAIYTVGARGYIQRYGTIRVTAWTLWVGTVGLLLIGVPQLGRLDWRGVSPLALGSVVYAGVLGVGLAYLLWYQAVRVIGNTRTAAYSNLVPVLALAVAWAWLDEVPSAWQLLGAAVIIGGVSLARRR